MKQPPKHAIAFLRWFCREDYIEEIEGDLLELYSKQEDQESAVWSAIKFWWTVLRYFRPAFIKSFEMHSPFNIHLLRLHIRVGWRTIRKSALFSAINIIGLAVAILCTIGIALYVYDEYKYDRFHSKLPQLFRVVETQVQAGVQYDVASTPGPLGPAMKADFPEVEATCRFGRTMGTIQIGDKVLEPDDIRYTDNSVFSMFDFNLLKGDKSTILTTPNEIVLTESIARKIWGNDFLNQPNRIGSTVVLNSWGQESIVRVSGIAADPVEHSHIRFSVLLPMASIEKTEYFNWDSNSYATYIQLAQGVDETSFNKKLRTYIDRYSTYGSKEDARILLLQPMKAIYLYSDFDFGTHDGKTGNILYIRIFLTVGTMVLLIALFNFVNLSTARAAIRTKEIGVRKVIGAKKGQLILQFLTEAWMLTFFAVLLALALSFFLLPFLNALSGKELALPVLEPGFWVLVAGFTILTGWLAGIYPAFILSGGTASLAIKIKTGKGSGQFFRKVLVIGQFSFSVILIIASIFIYRQLNFIQEKELGYEREHLLYVDLKNELRNKSGLFKNELKKMPGVVEAVQTSNNLINAGSSTGMVDWDGKSPGDEILLTHINTDADMIPTLGIALKAGRNFYKSGQDTASFILNETAVKKMGWTTDSAIGKSITLWQTKGKVVGVMQDFHFQPLTQPIEPFIFRSRLGEPVSGMLVKTKPGQAKVAISSIEKIYKSLEKKTTVQYQFVDQALEAQYQLQFTTGKIVLLFTFLAILVSCLGLFGLATFTTEQRTKEIGIRKVLGASIKTIVQLLTMDILKLVTCSIIIAIPISYWSMSSWMQNFAYRIPLDWYIFLGAGFIALLMAFVTVSFQSIKAALLNPAHILKSQ